MARITVEDCSKYVDNRFELILVAAQRGKQLNRGAVANIDNISREKEALVALREIAAGTLKIEDLERSIVKSDSEEDELKDSDDVLNENKDVTKDSNDSISNK